MIAFRFRPLRGDCCYGDHALLGRCAGQPEASPPIPRLVNALITDR